MEEHDQYKFPYIVGRIVLTCMHVFINILRAWKLPRKIFTDCFIKRLASIIVLQLSCIYHLLVLKVNVIILKHTNGYSVKSVADGITVCVQAYCPKLQVVTLLFLKVIFVCNYIASYAVL